MKITKAIRKEITPFLPDKYRVLIVERLLKKGIKVHANTVSNVLLRGNENDAVANEILALALECKKLEQTALKTMRQLSAA